MCTFSFDFGCTEEEKFEPFTYPLLRSALSDSRGTPSVPCMWNGGRKSVGTDCSVRAEDVPIDRELGRCCEGSLHHTPGCGAPCGLGWEVTDKGLRGSEGHRLYVLCVCEPSVLTASVQATSQCCREGGGEGGVCGTVGVKPYLHL